MLMLQAAEECHKKEMANEKTMYARGRCGVPALSSSSAAAESSVGV